MNTGQGYLHSSSQNSQSRIERRGLLLLLSSPSGAGKTTLAKRLLAGDPEITASVSLTTRQPRSSEVDGVDYHFVDQVTFETRLQSGELLEWARVFDHLYGTPKAAVETALAAGRDILFDIDWQGAQQIAKKMGEDLVRVFVLPPSADVLGERLRARAQDSAEVVADRMARASDEISHWEEYDYVIVNDDIDVSSNALFGILTAERQRRERQTGLSGLVQRIREQL